ncbi:glycoside hydrolase family 2 protein [Arachidicoccus terrestris]|uniref:glycoside hydrolase family 2 protein n=1 Tax=Arachidicoccus terrestris TaxID=2875539 RepID=UPI001CC57094|nr:sugar-binding domain-containing protein [Arachidicoccus terrestris]UAY55757.1 glycoside hydrolase family 2 [Arachidicoccus terrestris]
MNIRLQLLGLFLISSFNVIHVNAQNTWDLQSVPIQTRWAHEVSPINTWRAYPRPQMERDNWQNLNGLWDYLTTDSTVKSLPEQYGGQLLVPYPIESALSGVKKSLQPNQYLWYRRAFVMENKDPKEKTLLHFGAVDFEATVYINGKEVGRHSGGYTSFSFDITSLIKQGNNEIVVRVWDPTDQGYGPHGKQVLHPQNIYYTPSSGIWQTVWLETVPEAYIKALKITPDIDKSAVRVTVQSDANKKIEITTAGKTVKGRSNTDITIPISNPHLWSPEDPYLYDLSIKMGKDQVKSYFAMRKVSVQKDEKGIDRIFLNNQPYYNLGVLDQGFWPDGLYTAPTDEALAFDIKAIKAMGFNTLRKHIKIEPARWYYYADKIGMLVWQDMVNPNQGLPEGAKAAFEKQCKETIEELYNHPCITTWVLFNEKWGRYEQKRLTDRIKQMDPTRLVNGHSGELLYVNDVLRSPSPNAYVDADMTDVHSYPYPRMPIKQAGKAQVLGEFGGIGVFIPGHQWNASKAWGYIQEKPADLKAKYEIMNQHLQLLKAEGLSGSIYTQPYDVEGEQNGLMTYDRKVVKIPLETLRKIHEPLNPGIRTEQIPEINIQNADTTNPLTIYSDMLGQYIEGSRDTEFLRKMALYATQAGDKAGARMAANDLIENIRPPFSAEDIQTISRFTTSTKDPGFGIMQRHAAAFKIELGDRPYTVKMMNAIYHGEMEPVINSSENPDWMAIRKKISSYGPPGEEIFLRAETIYFLNKKDWDHYRPVAKEYLDKYGQYIDSKERLSLEEHLDKQ